MAVAEQERPEATLGGLLAKIDSVGEKLGGLAEIQAKVTDIAGKVEGLEKLDIKTVMAEFEKQKAGFETLREQIRRSKSGFHVPGIEDEAPKFSFLRALVAIKMRDWKGAGLEKEVLDAARAKAAQQIGDDKLGGYFVPDQVIPDVIQAIYTRSAWINLDGTGETSVSVLSGLVGGNVKIPKFTGGVLAYWMGEQDAYIESAALVGDISMNPKKLGVLVRLTDSMIRFQGFGFDRMLRNDMTRAAAKKIDFSVPYGSGTDNEPRGIARTNGVRLYSAQSKGLGAIGHNLGIAPFQADWQGAELDFDGLDNMMMALEESDISPDSTSRTISSPRFFRRLRQLKVSQYAGQTTEKSYLLGAPMLPNARLAELIGPFGFSTQIPSNNLPGESVGAPTTSTVEKFTDVFHGNMGEVIVGRWGAIEVEDDAGRGPGFLTDHTYLKLRLYMDVSVRQPLAVVLAPDARARD